MKTLKRSTIEPFKASLRGRLVEPEDPDYNTARKLYNAMIDKRPGAIAQCADVADVMAAVEFARENKLLLADSRWRS